MSEGQGYNSVSQRKRLELSGGFELRSGGGFFRRNAGSPGTPAPLNL